MQVNKMALVTIISILLLLIIIGWAFYETLTFSTIPRVESNQLPQKAVMEQARALKVTQLNEQALLGEVVKGMNMEQVRTALGNPDRVEKISSNGEQKNLWWYQHNGRKSIVFNEDGIVIEISFQNQLNRNSKK